MEDTNIATLYYLLYARYGNSVISSYDETQFMYKVFSTMFMYGPTWEKRLYIQGKVRTLDETQIIVGSKRINNRSYNPSIAPTTGTLDELTTVNEQIVDGWKIQNADRIWRSRKRTHHSFGRDADKISRNCQACPRGRLSRL